MKGPTLTQSTLANFNKKQKRTASVDQRKVLDPEIEPHVDRQDFENN